MKARIWKDRETGRWCYGLAFAERAGDFPTWEEALAEALTMMTSHSSQLGLPLRVVPNWHPSPFAWTRPA